MIIVNIYYLICLVVLYFVELACLDYAYCHLPQHITDNGNSKVSKIEGHEIIANLLLSKDSDLKIHCGKHNIRKINIRSLSDLLNVKFDNLFMTTFKNVNNQVKISILFHNFIYLFI